MADFKSYWKEVLVGCASLVMASGISYVAWTTHELVKKVENLPDKVVSVEMYEHQKSEQQVQIDQLRQTVDNLMINLAAHQQAEHAAFKSLNRAHQTQAVFADQPLVSPEALTKAKAEAKKPQ